MDRFKAVGARFDPTGKKVKEGIGDKEVRLALSDERGICLVRKGGKMSPLMAKFVGRMPENGDEASGAEFAQQLALSLALELERVQILLLNCPPLIIGKLAANVQKSRKDGDDVALLLEALSRALQMMPSDEEIEKFKGEPAPTEAGPKGWPKPFEPKGH